MDVLVTAESGTGKELLARLIHQSSDRRNRPFVAVNCAAFPEALLESELFGHARGAFTGAVSARPGKFELANTGTLLLDEIGELPLQLQPKLLRALQEREIDRLGDTKPVHVDVRVIATTNRPLASLAETGEFRADLYYRLNVVPLTIPPLRERGGDIQRLVEHFVAKHAASGRGPAPEFLPELFERLEQHDWPGNVRELENFVRRAIALHRGERLGPSFFDEGRAATLTIVATAAVAFAAAAAAGATGTCTNGAAGAIAETVAAGAPRRSLRDMERELFESTLEAEGGNRTRTARSLGISARTVRNKVKEYGLPPRKY